MKDQPIIYLHIENQFKKIKIERNNGGGSSYPMAHLTLPSPKGKIDVYKEQN